MSQLVSAKDKQLLAPEGEVPMGGYDTEEVLEAIEAFQATMVLLVARLNSTVAKSDNQKTITDMQDQMAMLRKAFTDFSTAAKKKRKWEFVVKKDGFGELEKVIATQIE